MKNKATARAGRPRPAGLLWAGLDVIERKTGLTASGLTLIGLGAIAWILGRLLSNRALFMLAYGAILVLLISWSLGRRRLTIEAQRSKLPTRVREGQPVEVQLDMVAKRSHATLILEEHMPENLGPMVRLPIPTLPAGHEVNHVYSFSPRLRGAYEIGPLVAVWSDPFGLTTKTTVLSEPVPIIVHPTTEPVHDRVVAREWEDPPMRPPLSRPWPTGFEFYGMRDYVAGDDPRRIIWRATARTLDPDSGAGRYLVRESEQGVTDRVSLILDTDRRAHSPGDPSETFELAIRAVASLGVHHLSDGFNVTIETNGGRKGTALRSRSMIVPFLDHMARIQMEPETLASSLRRLLVGSHRGLHNVIVAPNLDQESARAIGLLLERGASVLIALTLWEDSDPQSRNRANALGCSVIELRQGVSLEASFQRVVGAGIRKGS